MTRRVSVAEAINVLRALGSKMRDSSLCWCLAATEEDYHANDDEPDGRYGEIHEDACERARELVARAEGRSP